MNYVNHKSLEDLDHLRAQLIKTDKWPVRYMFKFIAPNNPLVIRNLLSVMPPSGQTQVIPSKGLRYVTLTHVNNMHSADDIIRLTIQATAIDGVIAL